MVVNKHLPVAMWLSSCTAQVRKTYIVQSQSCNVSTAATDPRTISARTSHVPITFASSRKPCRYGKTSWPLRLDRRSSNRSLETSCRISCESHVTYWRWKRTSRTGEGDYGSGLRRSILLQWLMRSVWEKTSLRWEQRVSRLHRLRILKILETLRCQYLVSNIGFGRLMPTF